MATIATAAIATGILTGMTTIRMTLILRTARRTKSGVPASTIARWQQRYRDGGLEALGGRAVGRRRVFSGHWAEVAVRWVTGRSPRDFGSLTRSCTASGGADNLTCHPGARPSHRTGGTR